MDDATIQIALIERHAASVATAFRLSGREDSSLEYGHMASEDALADGFGRWVTASRRPRPTSRPAQAVESEDPPLS